MTTPTPPPPTGPQAPTTGAPGDEPGGTDLKPWIPAIALAVVLVVLLVVLLVVRSGDDGTSATTTTTSSSTSTSTSSTTTRSSTTSTIAAAATSTAPPATTTVTPSTSSSTSTTTTAASTPAERAALVGQCDDGDEFACYEVGRLGLPPPSSIQTGNRWFQAPDGAVVTGCQQDLDTTACYVAGVRGLVLTD